VKREIYFSMVLFPKAPPSLAPLFTLATAVAMHNAVERYTGLDVDIKWPNDLLVGSRSSVEFFPKSRLKSIL
jgi:BirA family biotin operon repressor/biotin-[acetyl-CoA-carboxylase] ligase